MCSILSELNRQLVSVVHWHVDPWVTPCHTLPYRCHLSNSHCFPAFQQFATHFTKYIHGLALASNYTIRKIIISTRIPAARLQRTTCTVASNGRYVMQHTHSVVLYVFSMDTNFTSPIVLLLTLANVWLLSSLDSKDKCADTMCLISNMEIVPWCCLNTAENVTNTPKLERAPEKMDINVVFFANGCTCKHFQWKKRQTRYHMNRWQERVIRYQWKMHQCYWWWQQSAILCAFYAIVGFGQPTKRPDHWQTWMKMASE